MRNIVSTLAIIAATLEKIAIEIRHLQRTEVREAEEPFGGGQRGSSAMPHKRNPVALRTDLRPGARGAGQRDGGARRCGAVARARHLAQFRRARDSAGLDHSDRLHAHDA